MNILLDTHITIWVATGDNRLTEEARQILTASDNRIYYSALSVIEVDWKTKSKKNNLEFGTDEYIKMCHNSGYIPAPLRESYIAAS